MFLPDWYGVCSHISGYHYFYEKNNSPLVRFQPIRYDIQIPPFTRPYQCPVCLPTGRYLALRERIWSECDVIEIIVTFETFPISDRPNSSVSYALGHYFKTFLFLFHTSISKHNATPCQPVWIFLTLPHGVDITGRTKEENRLNLSHPFPRMHIST